MAIKNVRPPASIPPLPALPWNLARQPLWDYLRKMWDAFAGRPNVFGDNIPVGTPSTGTGGSSGGTTNTVVKFTGAGDVATIGNSTITDDGTLVTINTTTKVRATISGASETSNFLNVTGTLASTTTERTNGVYFGITSAGSSANIQRGEFVVFSGGYTGSAATSGLEIFSSVAGTASTWGTARFGNRGFISEINSSTAGTNLGIIGNGINGGSGDVIGVFGCTYSTTGSGHDTAVVGLAKNTTSSTAGYFGFAEGGNPTIPSASLVANNSAIAVPIFIAQDNGTKVFSIEDGGQLNLASDASRAIHSGTKTLTEAAATSIVTVGVPSGSVVGFVVEWTVQANDATDYQSRCGSTYVACVNKAGTLTAVVSDIGTSAFAESAGASTLTVATTAATGTNDVSFQLNATSSLTQTTLSATYFIRKMRGTGTLTPL